MRFFISAILVAVTVAFANLASAEGEHDHAEPMGTKAQTHCPVMGGKISKNAFVDYKGKRVYFCCPGCDKKFLANADERIAAMEAKGVVFEKAPEAAKVKAASALPVCPVSNEPIEDPFTFEYEGKTIQLCCKMCLSKFKKDPAKYLQKAASTAGHEAPAADGHEGHNH